MYLNLLWHILFVPFVLVYHLYEDHTYSKKVALFKAALPNNKSNYIYYLKQKDTIRTIYFILCYIIHIYTQNKQYIQLL